MMDNSNQRLIRWSLALQQYDFHVAYRSGKENGNADSLSRQPFEEATFSEEEGVDVRGISMDLEPDCPDMESQRS